ncbi:unnamed protein product [Prunus armeniaca]|uniref:Uncharacterized protein n=1 Tax=Prunus armeniaca TaxID=36596 RepID=A0A6J5TIV5_PRUAR|nr:unnamed protein product [Prunus armeniaca]
MGPTFATLAFNRFTNICPFLFLYFVEIQKDSMGWSWAVNRGIEFLGANPGGFHGLIKLEPPNCLGFTELEPPNCLGFTELEPPNCLGLIEIEALYLD